MTPGGLPGFSPRLFESEDGEVVLGISHGFFNEKFRHPPKRMLGKMYHI